jgi:hypothetical protein
MIQKTPLVLKPGETAEVPYEYSGSYYEYYRASVRYSLYGSTVKNSATLEMVPGLMAAIFHVCSRVSVPQWLTSTSFGVYVTHSMLAYLMFGVFSVLHIGRAGETLFVYGFLRFLLVCGSAVVLVCVLKRIAPNVSRIMFGGR